MIITKAIEAAKNGAEIYRSSDDTFTVYMNPTGALFRDKGENLVRFIPSPQELFAKDWEIRTQGAPIQDVSMHNILNLMNKQFVAAL